MNFGSNDNIPILVAPRPVRLNCAPYILHRAPPVRIVSEPIKDTAERSHSAGDLKVGLYESSSDVSPRSSPRTGLPTEALEEFLSILKPSIFPPRSPVRSRRQASLPALHYDHSFSFKGRPRIESTVEEVENVRSTQSSRNTSSPAEIMDGTMEFQFPDLENTPFRWFTSNVLSSPISRNNTRNPFHRHVTHPIASSPRVLTPSPMLSLSPAAIPLPLPSPDELAYA
ncbi:hypothetical protein J3R30DRAFT_941505 [Lentinula aciculospora]|uniref:Uncharacterized protein n=1 Tax=Lentinula aciculospora TaxID=153920 RepID=A0A9W9DWC4_9AGAR|nr:hypothetical protein J3R30DRAFT_941505 [Lentinula aciculospora]